MGALRIILFNHAFSPNLVFYYQSMFSIKNQVTSLSTFLIYSKSVYSMIKRLGPSLESWKIIFGPKESFQSSTGRASWRRGSIGRGIGRPICLYRLSTGWGNPSSGRGPVEGEELERKPSLSYSSQFWGLPVEAWPLPVEAPTVTWHAINANG